MEEEKNWDAMDARERKKALFQKQQALLDTFLAHGAISKAQYDKSLGDIKEKMGFTDIREERRSEDEQDRSV